jgi:hypothetical protein
MYKTIYPDVQQPEDAQPVNIIPTYIWKFSYDFKYVENLFKSVIDSMIADTPDNHTSGSALEIGTAFSTVRNRHFRGDEYQPHCWDLLQDYNAWLESRLFYVWHYLNYFGKSPQIINSWLNIHKRTGQTLEHNHNHAPLVVSAYLNLPEGSGLIEFRDPLEYHKYGLPYEPQEFLWTPIEIKTNDVLIFPGWMKHRTQESNSDEDRVVLTYNIG